MYWYWVNVYYKDRFVGSFYTDIYKKLDIVKELNNRYNNWDRYTIE